MGSIAELPTTRPLDFLSKVIKCLLMEWDHSLRVLASIKFQDCFDKLATLSSQKGELELSYESPWPHPMEVSRHDVVLGGHRPCSVDCGKANFVFFHGGLKFKQSRNLRLSKQFFFQPELKVTAGTKSTRESVAPPTFLFQSQRLETNNKALRCSLTN